MKILLTSKKGFTLLLAAVIASIVLSLGSSIFLIAQKQVTLSALGRDSQFAFYAADAGAECALYWDLRDAAFATTTPNPILTCDGHTLTLQGQQGTPPYTINFAQDFYVNGDGVAGTADDNGYCVEVAVTKNASNPYTVIRSNGYSVPCADKTTSNRALQRTVELHY